jgi:TRAP-type C4-dicarboxylate transport system permease small subunit
MLNFLRLHKAYGALLHRCGILAGIMTFAMMLLVVINVALRYTLNISVPGTLEITESLLTVLIFLSLALTQYEGGHIQVVLFTNRFPPSVRHSVRCIAMLLGLLFFTWCSWGAWGEAVKSFAINEQEWGSVRFPLYPVKFIVFAGLLMLAFQFAFDAVAAALGVDPHADEDVVQTTLEEAL